MVTVTGGWVVPPGGGLVVDLVVTGLVVGWVVTVTGVSVLGGTVLPGGQSGALRLSRSTRQDLSISSRETPTITDAVPVATHACSKSCNPFAL